MTKYFLIDEKSLVKGISSKDFVFFLAEKAYIYHKNTSWREISRNEINDRLMGYDPTEETIGYRIGNFDIMDEIREIGEAEAAEFIEKLGLDTQ